MLVLWLQGQQATADDMDKMCEHLKTDHGPVLVGHPQEAKALGSNAGYYAVLSQALGISCDAGNAAAVRKVKLWRGKVRSFLDRVTKFEQMLEDREKTWTAAIQKTHGATSNHPDDVANALHDYIKGVAKKAPMTHVDLAALAKMLPNVAVTVYSPALSLQDGFKYTHGDGAAPQQHQLPRLPVLVANVPSTEQLSGAKAVKPLQDSQAAGPSDPKGVRSRLQSRQTPGLSKDGHGKEEDKKLLALDTWKMVKLDPRAARCATSKRVAEAGRPANKRTRGPG